MTQHPDEPRLLLGGPADGQRVVVDPRAGGLHLVAEAPQVAVQYDPAADGQLQTRVVHRYMAASLHDHHDLVEVYVHQSLRPDRLIAHLVAGYRPQPEPDLPAPVTAPPEAACWGCDGLGTYQAKGETVPCFCTIPSHPDAVGF